MPKFITKTLIQLADLWQGRRISILQKEFALQNNSDNPTNHEALKAYLRSWNLPEDIRQIPPMTKVDIRRHSEKVDLKKVYKVSFTGGSTGEPLKTLLSRERANVRTASLFYYNDLAGYQPGDPFLLNRSKNESTFMKWLKNEEIYVPNDLSDKRLHEVFHILVRNQSEILIGYPSVIYAMGLFLMKHPEYQSKIKIRSIITSAEPVDNERLNVIQKAFSCSVLDRYANEENGILAHQRTFQGPYFVDRYNFLIEVVNPETFQPVGAGEIGKILVTDWKSELIPLVRYDTGDFAEVESIKNGQVYTIKNIVGRVVDQFTKTDGTLFNPLTLGPFIRLPLTELSIVFQFQFAQMGEKTFLLRLKTQGALIPENNRNRVVEGLKSALGQDAEIQIEIVEDIPARKSGKRPLYVNEWKVGK
jgi:phenylacetate-CoA ligase